MSRPAAIARSVLASLLLFSLALVPAARQVRAAHVSATSGRVPALGGGDAGTFQGAGAELRPRAYLPLIAHKACGWPLPFEDTFAENKDAGWLPAVGLWEIAGEEYRLYSRDGADEYTFIGSDCWSDYILRADVRYTDGVLANDFGIAFYVSPDHQSLYKLMINGGNLVRLLYVEHRGRDINHEIAAVPSPIPFLPGRWYTLKAVVGEGRIRCSVEGQTVIDVQDNTLTQGLIGMMSDGFAATLHYDNVKVY